MIRVQREDFDPGRELETVGRGRSGVGGVASFVGLVRGEADGVAAMTLEHYPGMTERQLTAIEEEARHRWTLLDVRIVHRYGRLLPGERIVFVAVGASHRQDAFAACEFLVDWLKTRAPFWKLEEGKTGAEWVSARSEDDVRAARWEKTR
jgi:molybdopterin synthase catalytic subunit